MNRTTLSLLLGISIPAITISQDATEVPEEEQSGAEIQVRGEESSTEAKIRRLQQMPRDQVGETAGEQLQEAEAIRQRREANAEKRAAMRNDTANPNSTPLKAEAEATQSNDTSELANPAAKPLQDTIPSANPESMPVEENQTSTPTVDTAQGLANPASKPTDVNADTTAVTDRMPENANPEASAITANIEPTQRTTDTDPTEAGQTTEGEEKAAATEARMPEPSEVTPRPEAAPTGDPNAVQMNTATATSAGQTPTATTTNPEPAATSDTAAVANAEATARARKERSNRTAPNEKTSRILEEKRRDRTKDAAVAAKIEDDDDANSLIYSILGGAAAGAIAAKVATSDDRARAEAEAYRRGRRLPVNEVGRTQRDRDQSVDYLVRRFEGDASMQEAPYYRDQRRAEFRQPIYYNGNRRVVRYANRNEIPPVLIASERLDRVDLVPAREANWRPVALEANRYYNEVPAAYNSDNAYALSYSVDPNSAVSRDDILFQQGSTAFADAYSYDLVLDLAEAMKSSALGNRSFIIEGHASAEGDYAYNLRLSQDRAERIARDLVAYGVEPSRLVPVGYGEAEANYPASAPESQRSLDRRVMVFRMED